MPGVQPPQGNQKNVVTKPHQVYAEQYRVGQPLPIGAVVELGPPFPPENGPYLNGTQGLFSLKDGDWVITHKRTGLPIEAITDEEYSDRYGAGGPAVDA